MKNRKEKRTRMKRYLLFIGLDYYASGGMHDFHSSHDTEEEATKEGVRYARETPDIWWWHVYDGERAAVVSMSQYQGYGASCDDPLFANNALQVGVQVEVFASQPGDND